MDNKAAETTLRSKKQQEHTSSADDNKMTQPPVVSSPSSSSVVLITEGRVVDAMHGAALVVEHEKCQEIDVLTSSVTTTSHPIRKWIANAVSGFTTTDKDDDGTEREMKVRPHHTFMEDGRSQGLSNDDDRESSETHQDSDDSELHDRYFNNATSIATKLDDRTRSLALPPFGCYILGKLYHEDAEERRRDESSLFWFTYRCDFPKIEPYGITSDAGWGCMLRALQMLTAQALRMHYRCRDWKPGKNCRDGFSKSILHWFADCPSTTQCFYSLHNMVAVGLAKYDKLPGEWYGPGTACYVLRDLAEMHAKNDARMFRVHVVGSAGSVYRDEIETTMTRDSKARYEKSSQPDASTARTPEHPLAAAWEEIEPLHHPWDTALLLLIPLRLGLKHFNEDYMGAVAHMFSLPQSVGVLGGRPRGARWFYGAVADGSQILGLDPHTVQTAPPCRAGNVILTDEYIRSVHTTYTEVFSLAKMDPSIALGFYCRDRSVLETLLNSLKNWKEKNPNGPELFTVADTAPNYVASSAMHDVMMCSMLDVEDDNSNSSEDEEYVML